MSQTLNPANTNGEEIGLDLKIETPENVVLTYQLAGPAIRCAAYMVDFAVRVIIVLGISIAVSIFSIVIPGTATGIFLLVMFFMEWCYFIVAEGFFNGKTLGKHTFGLRVIHDRGHPLTLWGAVLRNLLRSVDAIPLYGIGFVSMLLSRKSQRLGDLVSGTVVIAERRVVLPREPIILEKIESLSRQEMGSYVPDRQTLTLIEDFLTRRHILTHERGHSMAAPVARALAERLNFSGDPDLPSRYPMAFLARIYVTFLRREDEEDDQIDWKPNSRRLGRRQMAESR